MKRKEIYPSFVLALFVVFTFVWQPVNAQIKVACIGNSVTYGYGIENREINSYPAQLQKLLGEKYEVANFGLSGATLLTKGHRPYIKNEIFKNALSFNPEMVIIHLGLNDTDPRNWPNFREDFIKDYSALIDSFRQLPCRPKVWVCKMTPIFHGHPRFKSGTRDWFWQIQNKIEVLANGNGTELIDLHTPLYARPDLMPDNLHPNKEGTAILASTVYQRLTGDFGGLQIPDIFGDNMVLQRGVPIPVYGTANRGQLISVVFGDEKRTVSTDKFGKWRLEFTAHKEGGPFLLKIANSAKEVIFKNILIGDLYLCSGQSNMAFRLDQTALAQTEILKANYPEIRLYNMKTVAWGNKREWTKEELDKTNKLNFFEGKWEECASGTAAEFSGIAYYFGRKIYEETGIPIGLICNAKGGSPTEAWIDRKTLEFHPQLVDVLSNWEKNDYVQQFCRERAAFNIRKAETHLQRHPFHPAYLFESGIKPIIKLPLNGVIWCQGESNAHNVEFHEQLFPALLQSWRKEWGEELPFYFVQLSSINRPSWNHFRDSQRRLAKQIPNCEMVVCSDLGHPTDVHPKQKKQVGERLAMIVLNQLYNKNIQWQGPTVNHYHFNENRILVKYAHAKQLTTSNDNDLDSFEIAGENEIYYSAEIHVVGNTIELWSEKVAKPKFFRYGYQPYSSGNLINEAGLPASTYTNEFEQ